MSIRITELGPGSLAVKDLFDTAGVRTSYGSPIFGDRVPSVSAEAVARPPPRTAPSAPCPTRWRRAGSPADGPRRRGLRAADGALAPGFAPTEFSLEDVRIGVAWTERADPLVRARVEAVAEGFEPVEVSWPDGVYAIFQREIVEVHGDLYPANRERYDPGIAHKLDIARKVTDAAAAERERYRAALEVDLLFTPTVPTVALPVGIGDVALRELMIELTFPWKVTGSPALALPCGPAEDGLPASLQIIGKPGDDALVLAAGRALSERVRAADPASR